MENTTKQQALRNVIVVIGAGSIGQAIVRRISAGKHIVLADLRQENADAAAKILSDAGFEVTWKKVAPKIFLIKGKINLIPTSEYKDLASEGITHFYRDNEKANANMKKAWRDGCRVRYMICDYDYKMPDLQTFSWKLDTTKTIVWDSIYVGGGTFSERIDLSQDPEFYPFKAEKYKLVISIVPQQPNVPDYVQDRIGWKGEALTDKSIYEIAQRDPLNFDNPRMVRFGAVLSF